MKYSILLMVCAITVTAYHANAQYWALSGNNIYNTNDSNVQITRDLEMLGNNNGTSTLGAIRWGGETIASKRTAGGNQNGLDFYTNSQNRMSITNAGNVKITRDLEMLGNNNGTATLGAIRWGGETITSKRTAGGNQNGLDFYTNSTNRMSITNAGKVGIGTNIPTSLLSVVKATAGATVDFRNSSMGPNISWIHFGSTGDWYIRSAAHNGNVIMQDQSANSKVGIGTTNPFRKFEVKDGDIRIRTTDTPRFLEFVDDAPNRTDYRFKYYPIPGDEFYSTYFYVSSSNDNFNSNSVDIARFAGSFGYQFEVYGAMGANAYNVTSDYRLKKDIKNLNNALEIINKLQPKTYLFKNEEYTRLNLPKAKQYGFLAQDIEKILPELVTTSKEQINGESKIEELKSMNYTELIPILTKAIQEQQQQITTLHERMGKLETILKDANLSSGAKGNAVLIVSSEASLAQNVPNPYTNTTAINYTLPQKFTNAQIVITGKNGNVLKQVNLSGGGKGVLQVDASTLSSGAYNYSLYVDGKLVASKQMILAK